MKKKTELTENSMENETDEVDKFYGFFDLDGVVLDTESQYSVFWNNIGEKYFNDPDFGYKIKGQTLPEIFQKYFTDFETPEQSKLEQEKIKKSLDVFESEMELNYIPGALDFIKMLKRSDFSLAIVTSSNNQKMTNVYKKCPEIKELFHKIFTSEMFSKSKPDPHCYLLAAEYFGADSSQCFVFEDSFHGLEAGRAAKMNVVGLATTNPPEKIEKLCDYVVKDFTEIDGVEMLKIPVKKMNEFLALSIEELNKSFEKFNDVLGKLL